MGQSPGLVKLELAPSHFLKDSVVMAINRMFWLQPHRSHFSESVNNGVCLLVAFMAPVFVRPRHSR